jgi:hypothetical protein
MVEQVMTPQSTHSRRYAAREKDRAEARTFPLSPTMRQSLVLDEKTEEIEAALVPGRRLSTVEASAWTLIAQSELSRVVIPWRLTPDTIFFTTSPPHDDDFS